MPILDAAGLRCTFNLNSGVFAAPGTVYPQGRIHRPMTEEQAVRLYSGTGHEVAVHTRTHPDLTQLSAPEIVREVAADRERLEQLFGGIVRGAAYPFGRFNDTVVEVLRACGIAYCRTVISSHSFDLPRDPLRLEATCHHDDPRLEELCDRFLMPETTGLFYLWGHSYEFEAHDNWSLIENFARRMGGHEDIWYCTNIQAIDYIGVWRSVRRSMDGRTLHNPSAQTMWLKAPDGQVRCLEGGSTLREE